MNMLFEMTYEIWDRESGNRLGEFAFLEQAVVWLLELWSTRGRETVIPLTLGQEPDGPVWTGESLEALLGQFLWARPAVTLTAAPDPVREGSLAEVG